MSYGISGRFFTIAVNYPHAGCLVRRAFSPRIKLAARGLAGDLLYSIVGLWHPDGLPATTAWWGGSFDRDRFVAVVRLPAIILCPSRSATFHRSRRCTGALPPGRSRRLPGRP